MDPPESKRSSSTARDSSIAPSRSPDLAFSCAVWTSTTGTTVKLYRPWRAMSRTCASSSQPRSRSGPSRWTRVTPRANRAMCSASSSPDRSAIASASAVAQGGRIGQQRPNGNREKVRVEITQVRVERVDGTAIATACGSRLASRESQAPPGGAANAIAVLSGDPKIRLPLVGSPSAKSMTRCANRRASIISPASHLA